jgi:hypothetical protein
MPTAAVVPAALVAAPAANGDTQFASGHTGSSETAEIYGPEKSKAATTAHKGIGSARAHKPKPKKKAQVARTPNSVAPAASTGFPVQLPKTPSNTSINARFTNDAATR